MKHVLSSQPRWCFVKASYATGIKTPNVSRQKHAPWKYLSILSRKSWQISVLDISDLDKDAASLLVGCEVDTLLGVHMNPQQLSSIMKTTSRQLKIQSNVESVVIIGGAVEAKHVTCNALLAMLAFMARVFPNVDRISLHFSFEMPYEKENLQKLFEVRFLQESFVMPY